MISTRQWDTLTSNDRQSTLEIINQLGECRTRKTLNSILKRSILPLIDCCGVFYACLKGMQQGELQILDNIRSPALCLSWWENFHTTAIQCHLLDDLPINQRVSVLNSENFNCISHTFDHSHKNGTIMVLADLPNPTVALYFSRFNLPINKYSTRDINLLSFLQATLLQTVRAIIYWEESKSLQQIINELHGLDEPLSR